MGRGRRSKGGSAPSAGGESLDLPVTVTIDPEATRALEALASKFVDTLTKKLETFEDATVRRAARASRTLPRGAATAMRDPQAFSDYVEKTRELHNISVSAIQAETNARYSLHEKKLKAATAAHADKLELDLTARAIKREDVQLKIDAANALEDKRSRRASSTLSMNREMQDRRIEAATESRAFRKTHAAQQRAHSKEMLAKRTRAKALREGFRSAGAAFDVSVSGEEEELIKKAGIAYYDKTETIQSARRQIRHTLRHTPEKVKDLSDEIFERARLTRTHIEADARKKLEGSRSDNRLMSRMYQLGALRLLGSSGHQLVTGALSGPGGVSSMIGGASTIGGMLGGGLLGLTPFGRRRGGMSRFAMAGGLGASTVAGVLGPLWQGVISQGAEGLDIEALIRNTHYASGAGRIYRDGFYNSMFDILADKESTGSVSADTGYGLRGIARMASHYGYDSRDVMKQLYGSSMANYGSRLLEGRRGRDASLKMYSRGLALHRRGVGMDDAMLLGEAFSDREGRIASQLRANLNMNGGAMIAYYGTLAGHVREARGGGAMFHPGSFMNNMATSRTRSGMGALRMAEGALGYSRRLGDLQIGDGLDALAFTLATGLGGADKPFTAENILTGMLDLEAGNLDRRAIEGAFPKTHEGALAYLLAFGGRMGGGASKADLLGSFFDGGRRGTMHEAGKSQRDDDFYLDRSTRLEHREGSGKREALRTTLSRAEDFSSLVELQRQLVESINRVLMKVEKYFPGP